MPNARIVVLAVLSLCALPLGLAGCGEAPKAAPGASSAKRGVYTSANDCAENGGFKIESCSKAIELAITQHEAAAPSYTSLKACETTEGPNRCERAAGGRYRPRLIAFLVTASEPPAAQPLYATMKGEAGFRTAEHKNLLVNDDTLTFSEHAVTAYEANLPSGKRKSGFGM